MVRLRNYTLNLARRLVAIATPFILGACGNSGSIDFFSPSTAPNPTHNRGAATTLVPASLALAIESGKTTANGYHAKLQINFMKGTSLSSGGYKMNLKHTNRNR